MKDSVQTGVDALLGLLNRKGKISIADAAQELGIGEATIKLWVDFLVEEKVIGMEYKFTKPYIYLNKPTEEGKEGKIINEEQITLKKFKTEFEERAAASSIPQQQIGFLWKDHVINQLQLEKPFFFREARKRGLNNIDTLWQEYQGVLTKER